MSALIGILITFLVVILVLYLVNMLPIEGRAKHIVRIIVIIIVMVPISEGIMFHRVSRFGLYQARVVTCTAGAESPGEARHSCENVAKMAPT